MMVQCRAEWADDAATKQRIWNLLESTPAPVGYDPSIVPGWDSPQAPGFGILRLEPVSLRLMEGSAIVGGAGARLSWSRQK